MKKTFKTIVQNLLAYVSLNVFRGGQELVYTKIRDAIIKGYRTMYIEGPTGMGKSFIQSTLADAIISDSNLKVLLLVPKITLLSQMKREFTRFSKHLHLALFGGGKKDHGEQVTIMTYQSFLNVSSETLKQYAMIFLDEAHKALGEATRSKIEEQTHAIIIGFTATSSYSDKKNLKEFLKYEVYRISIPEAVKVGMLSAIQFIIGKVHIEISGRQKDETNLEYKERLGKDIIREGGNIAAVRLYKKIFQKRKTRFIMFTASVAQGHDLVRELHTKRVTAEIITGAMKTSERELLFKKFREGKFKVLVGIDTIKEGFDDPGVHGVMFVYPVGSKVDLIQGAGRGTRIDDANPNKVAYIVQLAFQTRKQVWYNDALEGKGPFVAPGDEFDGIELKKVKRFDVVITTELKNIADDIIESVSVEHEDVLSLIRNFDPKKDFYKTWQEARNVLMVEGIKNRIEYEEKYFQIDSKLPAAPSKFYKDFPGWSLFLDDKGSPKKKYTTRIIPIYKTWQEASKISKEVFLGKEDYKKRYKEIDLKLPSDPQVAYSNFPGWRVFLGKGYKKSVSRKKREEYYSTWKEASEVVQKLKITSNHFYNKHGYKKDKKLPTNPHRFYSNFPGWEEFFGTEAYKTLRSVKEAVNRLKITSKIEYKKRYKEDLHLRSRLDIIYSNFPGWEEFFKKK